MKQMWKEITIAAFLGLILPSILLSLAVRNPEEAKQPVASLTTTAVTEWIAPTEPQNDTVKVAVLDDGQWRTLEMEDYLVGVVLAEMPVSFEAEAHKAQAVVARTYALKNSTSIRKHNGGVCTDATCCQGYLSVSEFLESGGTPEELSRVETAVAATKNLVLTYHGELIEATYFSCSGGYTEDAVAVWGTDIPYLQSVESPGEEHATHYSDSVRFTAEEFAGALGLESLGSPNQWFGAVQKTAGGGVELMEICGTSYKGTTLRQLLGLRSTAFSVEADATGVTVITKGYGHRVGMSQYGADAMAASGATFQEILQYYYQGTELTAYTGNQMS